MEDILGQIHVDCVLDIKANLGESPFWSIIDQNLYWVDINNCLLCKFEKKWDLKKFEKIIKLKKRENCAPPAPANGLFLSRVFY